MKNLNSLTKIIKGEILKMQDLILYFHQDGGHAWVKVSKDTFNRTNLTMRHISTFSYHDNKNYYLEISTKR